MPKQVQSTVGGVVMKQLVAAGDTIDADTEVAMIESMKMHIPVVAEHAGKVGKWLVAEGATVKEGQPLLVLDA